jgi:hypothetical protein
MIALAALSVAAIFPSSGSAAETCIAAPNAPAPQGSHWYYRLERATQRKCWRLVKLDREPQATAKQAAAAPDPADEEDAAPVAETSTERARPVTQHGWLTRSASAVPETPAPTQSTPDRASAPADDQAAAPPPVPGGPEQASEAAAPGAPVQAAEPQPTNVAAQDPAAASAGAGMTQFVFLVIAGIGLLAAAIFFIVDLRRRRTDVLTRIARQDITSFEPPEAEDPEDAPTFSAMPPMRLMPQHDDVDEALRRSRRRRMAA